MSGKYAGPSRRSTNTNVRSILRVTNHFVSRVHESSARLSLANWEFVQQQQQGAHVCPANRPT